ncbi:MAG: hypothetical protein ACRDF7_11675, partial [Candidatus Limnocylindrales bacterium]
GVPVAAAEGASWRGTVAVPAPPAPPRPPAPPAPPVAPPPPEDDSHEAARLEVLRALAAREIDVQTAIYRLTQLDDGAGT